MTAAYHMRGPLCWISSRGARYVNEEDREWKRNRYIVPASYEITLHERQCRKPHR